MPNPNEIAAVQITHNTESCVSFSGRNTGLTFLTQHDLEAKREELKSKAKDICPGCTYHELGAKCCRITPWEVKITHQSRGRYYENAAGPLDDCSLYTCIQSILGFDTTNS